MNDIGVKNKYSNDKVMLLSQISIMKDFALFTVKNFELAFRHDIDSVISFNNGAIEEALSKGRSFENISASTYAVLSCKEVTVNNNNFSNFGFNNNSFHGTDNSHSLNNFNGAVRRQRCTCYGF